MFESYLGVSSTEFFNDHRVYEAAVVPATAYVELAMAAASEVFGQGARALEDFLIQEAMILPEREGRAVQVAVCDEGEGGASVQIFSRSDAGEDAWSLHASASIVLEHKRRDGAAREHSTLESLRARFDRELPREVFEDRARAEGVSYGPSYQSIERVWGERNEALGLVRLPEGAEAENYCFHPALLDMCFQVVAAARASEADDSECYLPMSIDGFRRFAQPGEELWSYAYVHPERVRETFAADLVIFNGGGEVVAEVEGLRFKRANKAALLRGGNESLKDWLYELRWDASPLTPETTARDGEGRWLIFADGDASAAGLAARLRARGGMPVLVSPGESYSAGRGRCTIDPTKPDHYSRLIGKNLNHGARLRGVVYLWGAAPAATAPAASTEEMLRLMESGCGGALRVLRALVDAGIPQSPRLWLVTRGAQEPDADASPSAVAQSSLWGLGRTMALEHPELKVSLVDVGEGSTTDDEVALLLDELLGTGEGEQVSLRAGERRVARLARGRRLDVPASPFSFSAEATYLITGGLGGIGLKLARWMVERGACHLALLGRGGPSEAAQAVLSELEAGGAEVLVVRADVANRGQLAAALEEVSARMPPLRGVVHAALVLDDGVLLKQEWESFRRVTLPKGGGRLESAPVDARDAARLLRSLLFGALVARRRGAGQLHRGQRLRGCARATSPRRGVAGAQHQLGPVGLRGIGGGRGDRPALATLRRLHGHFAAARVRGVGAPAANGINAGRRHAFRLSPVERVVPGGGRDAAVGAVGRRVPRAGDSAPREGGGEAHTRGAHGRRGPRAGADAARLPTRNRRAPARRLAVGVRRRRHLHQPRTRFADDA